MAWPCWKDQLTMVVVQAWWQLICCNKKATLRQCQLANLLVGLLKIYLNKCFWVEGGSLFCPVIWLKERKKSADSLIQCRYWFLFFSSLEDKNNIYPQTLSSSQKKDSLVFRIKVFVQFRLCFWRRTRSSGHLWFGADQRTENKSHACPYLIYFFEQTHEQTFHK